MGIIMTTRGWTGASLLVQTAAGDESYTVSGDVQNAYEVATALLAWLDDPARVWAATLSTISMSVEDAGDGRLVFAFTESGSVAFDLSAASASWRARMAVRVNGGTIYGTARGTCSAEPGTVGWEQQDLESGGRAREHSWRTGHPSVSGRFPDVELAFDLDQHHAFGEAVRIAAAPRRAYLHDELSDTWRLCYVGEHDLAPHRADDVTRWSGSLAVMGVP